MLVSYIEDPENEGKIKSMLGVINFIIHGCQYSGKKTCLIQCIKSMGFKYVSLHVDLLNQQLFLIINDAMFHQELHIVHIYGIESCDTNTVFKEISKNLKAPFIQFIITSNTMMKIPYHIVKHFATLRFKDNKNHEKSINQFCKKYNIENVNIIDEKCKYILTKLKTMNVKEIRFITMNLTKNNFPLVALYKYVVQRTQNLEIVNKAVHCEHLGNKGNKKIYYLEHFLFFIKYGNLCRFIKT